jgi:prevent-host-death family protein
VSGHRFQPDIVWCRGVEVGIRSLRDHLSRHLDEVKEGNTVIVTEHGRPIARIVPIEQARSTLEDLIAEGVVTPAAERGGELADPLECAAGVSDLIEERRR